MNALKFQNNSFKDIYWENYLSIFSLTDSNDYSISDCEISNHSALRKFKSNK